MKITAKLGSCSSVVGQSISMHDETGRVVCLLAMLNIGVENHKELSNTYGQFVTDKINAQPTASVEEVAMAIVGPHLPVPAGSQWSLDELRKIRWDRLTETERQQARNAAKAALAALTPSTESGITRWVKTEDRQPTVGGSYITGNYRTDEPRFFERSDNCHMIILNGKPQWFDREKDIHGRTVDRDIGPPDYWLENLPPHPEHVA